MTTGDRYGSVLAWAKRHRVAIRSFRGLLAGTIVLLSAGLLWQQMREISPAQLRFAWSATPYSAIAISVFATALSFACLSAYERLATQWIVPGRIPARVAWGIGAAAHSISNTIGFHAVTAGAVRFRSYRAFGLGLRELVRVLAVVAGCTALGVASILALALLWLQASNGGLMLVLALLALLALLFRYSARQARLNDAATPGAIILAHGGRLCLIGAAEMAGAIGALYVLLPSGATPEPAWFALVYVGAMLLGIASHAPGGIGVFEAGILSGAPEENRAQVLVALLAYRLIYNLLPFALATVLLIAFSAPRRSPGQSVGGRVGAHQALLAEVQPGEPN